MKGCLQERNGVWYTTVDLRREPGSRRRQKRFRLGKFRLKRDADAAQRELLRRIDAGEGFESTRRTVGDLVSAWLRDGAHSLAARTVEGYSTIYRRHIEHGLGRMPLSRLKPEHFVEAYAEIRAKGIAPQTLLHIHRMLHTAFEYGRRVLRMITEDIMEFVPTPRNVSSRRSAIAERDVLAIVTAAKGTDLEVPVLFAAATGLRRSELLGLRWSDVRLDDEMPGIFVCSVVEVTRKHGVRLVDRTKSASSERAIPLGPRMVELLRDHRVRQDRIREKLGPLYQDGDLVFPLKDGRIWSPDYFTRRFRELADSVGIYKLRLHDLRHAFATLMLRDGSSIKEVSALMGHSSAVITMKTYARELQGHGREAITRHERSLFVTT